MECPKCLTKNPDTRKFCRECGYKILLLCPQCSFENIPGDKFCGECGHKLTEPSEATIVDFSEPQSYTPKFLADKILTSRSSIEGERKFVTVFFADVANYTALSERIDSEEVHQVMDGCFKILMDEIHRYEGTINQFTGDGVTIFVDATTGNEITSPIQDISVAQATVAVPNGQTVVLGGMITKRDLTSIGGFLTMGLIGIIINGFPFPNNRCVLGIDWHNKAKGKKNK